MAPHPQLALEDVDDIVEYILSLDPEKQMKETYLPLSGTIKFNAHTKDEVTGKYILGYLRRGHVR